MQRLAVRRGSQERLWLSEAEWAQSTKALTRYGVECAGRGVKWVERVTPGPCLESRLAEQQRQTCSKVSGSNFVASRVNSQLKTNESSLLSL